MQTSRELIDNIKKRINNIDEIQNITTLLNNESIKEASAFFIEPIMVILYREVFLKDGTDHEKEIRRMVNNVVRKKDGSLSHAINNYRKEYKQNIKNKWNTNNIRGIIEEADNYFVDDICYVLNNVYNYLYKMIVPKSSVLSINLNNIAKLYEGSISQKQQKSEPQKFLDNLKQIYENMLQKIKEEKNNTKLESAKQLLQDADDKNARLILVKQRIIDALNGINTASKILENSTVPKNIMDTTLQASAYQAVVTSFWMTMGQLSASIMPVDLKGFLQSITTSSGKELQYMQGPLTEADNTVLLYAISKTIAGVMVNIIMESSKKPIEFFKKIFFQNTDISDKEVEEKLMSFKKDKMLKIYRLMCPKSTIGGIEISAIKRLIKNDPELLHYYSEIKHTIINYEKKAELDPEKRKNTFTNRLRKVLVEQYRIPESEISNSVFIDLDKGAVMIAGTSDEGKLISASCYDFWNLSLPDPHLIFRAIKKKINQNLNEIER